MSVFKVIGMLDKLLFVEDFDCPIRLEIRMKEIDVKFENKEFKYGYLDVFNKNIAIRGFIW